ncbi:MAG TPA: DUF924 family protein [Acetobacteraceae bacterium]|nr:DUF924 family protein [Acetobacteraceae bacterium]
MNAWCVNEASRIVSFWRAAGPQRWFAKDPKFDAQFRQQYLGLHIAAARRECDSWITAPQGALALLLLLDQFPRNAFRGTAHMYATDPLARFFARKALASDYDDQVEVALRRFLYLPFAHSEKPQDQKLSVELSCRVSAEYAQRAREHCRIIQQFGRFPHRNRLLGRRTTAGEAAFLLAGGFAG